MIVMCLFLFSSCTVGKKIVILANKFVDKQRELNERDNWNWALDLASRSWGDERIALQCGFNFKEMTQPKIFAMTFDELQKAFRYAIKEENPGVFVSGFYDHETSQLYYDKDNENALVHEYFHAIMHQNLFFQVGAMELLFHCTNEFAARLGGIYFEREKMIELRKRMNQKKARRNIHR